jgi:hypothetical protein
MWHSTAQQQHSIAQHSRGGACWVLTAPVYRGVFFCIRRPLVCGLGNVAGFVSEEYLNTRSPLGWCRGSLGGGLCCVCVW